MPFEACDNCGQNFMVPISECTECGWTPDADEAAAATVAELGFEPDRLGDWSDIKHDILAHYAPAYTRILKAQRFKPRTVCVDAFAGGGIAIDKQTGERLKGSATLMVEATPPFDELHFIEQDPAKVANLVAMFGHDRRVVVHQGDTNEILVSKVLPRCRYTDYARALIILDPYGFSLDWSVIEALGKEKGVEIFFNFMIVDVNRNVLWKDPTKVRASQRAKMLRAWGGDWTKDLYKEIPATPSLFDEAETEPTLKKVTNMRVAEVMREKLQKAGFTFVPPPIPMRNSRRATIYYLYFASHNETGASIVEQVFAKFRSY